MCLFDILEYGGGYGGGNAGVNYVDYSQPPPTAGAAPAGGYSQGGYNQGSWNQNPAPAAPSYGGAQGIFSLPHSKHHTNIPLLKFNFLLRLRWIKH